MTILAIDPGLTGAYALLGDIAHVGDLPAHQAQHGRSAKRRAELDLHSMRALLAIQPIEHCFIVRVASRPGQGSVSMFRFGEAAGAIYGLLIGLSLPVSFVTPQQWQRHHGVGPSPDAARQRAMQLFPELVAALGKKRDQHRADAILIAAYGRQVLQGTHNP